MNSNIDYYKKYLKYKKKYTDLRIQVGGQCKNKDIPEPYCRIIEEPCSAGLTAEKCKEFKINEIDSKCSFLENCMPYKCKVDPKYSSLCAFGQTLDSAESAVSTITDKNVVKSVASTGATVLKKLSEVPKLILDPNKALERASEILFGYTEFLEEIKKAIPYHQKIEEYIKYLRGEKICQKTVDKLENTNKELKELLDTFKKSAKDILKNSEEYGNAVSKQTVIEVTKSTDARLDPNKYKKIINELYGKISILLNEIEIDLKTKNDKCYVDPDLKDIPAIGKVPAKVGEEIVETHLLIGEAGKAISKIFGNN